MLSETKLASVVGANEPRQAHPEEIREWFGADPGSLGPIGLAKTNAGKIRVLADLALKDRKNMICGANRNDYHLRNVTPGKDFQAEFADLRQVAEGDTTLETGDPLEITKTVEIGHIFKLGYKYSEAMGLRVLNESGGEVTVIMGSYGIGMERILCAAIELYHDKDGISMPPSIAPFQVVITPIHFADETWRETATRIYEDCKAAGLDALLDDRDERPGVKFKDADLIGIPYRVTIGKKLAQGLVEVSERRTKTSADVAVDGIVPYLCSKMG